MKRGSNRIKKAFILALPAALFSSCLTVTAAPAEADTATDASSSLWTDFDFFYENTDSEEIKNADITPEEARTAAQERLLSHSALGFVPDTMNGGCSLHLYTPQLSEVVSHIIYFSAFLKNAFVHVALILPEHTAGSCILPGILPVQRAILLN